MTKENLPPGVYGWLLDKIAILSFVWAIVIVAFVATDARYNYSPIPVQYYRIPRDGDSFPVTGNQFWIFVGSVFVITSLDSMFGLLYGVWRWRKAFKEKLRAEQTFFTVSGMETFLAITRTFLVILSVGHVLFLISSILARTMVMILTIYAKPFSESATGAMYSKQYKKLGYSSL